MISYVHNVTPLLAIIIILQQTCILSKNLEKLLYCVLFSSASLQRCERVMNKQVFLIARLIKYLPSFTDTGNYFEIYILLYLQDFIPSRSSKLLIVQKLLNYFLQ